jgi:hypothetical protein
MENQASWSTVTPSGRASSTVALAKERLMAGAAGSVYS